MGTARTPRRCSESACGHFGTRFASTVFHHGGTHNGECFHVARTDRLSRTHQPAPGADCGEHGQCRYTRLSHQGPGLPGSDATGGECGKREDGASLARSGRVAGASGREQRECRPRESTAFADAPSAPDGRAADQGRVPQAADGHQRRELTMGLFDMLTISGSALAAERQRAEGNSAKLANAETTHTDSGGPYVRKEVVFDSAKGSPFRTVFNGVGSFAQPPAGSVHITQVVNDTTPPVMRYEPGN